MTFQSKVKDYLSDYKVKRFPKKENGVWKRNGKETTLGYAFKAPLKNEAHPDSDLNLLEPYKNDFLKYEQSFKGKYKIKRHIYFHHLNSSQAMCFNFFFPLFKDRKLDLITDFLLFQGETIEYDTVCFEKESKVEGKDRRSTYFDFYFETKSGKKFYFEIKYTENEFGSAPKDKGNNKLFDLEHLEKFENVYSQHLDVLTEKYKSKESFLSNYQIMRNIINVSENSHVVFVYPKDNEKVRKQAEIAKKEMLQKPFDKHIHLAEWNELYEAIKTSVKCPILEEQYKEFWDKYLNIAKYEKIQ